MNWDLVIQTYLVKKRILKTHKRGERDVTLRWKHCGSRCLPQSFSVFLTYGSKPHDTSADSFSYSLSFHLYLLDCKSKNMHWFSDYTRLKDLYSRFPTRWLLFIKISRIFNLTPLQDLVPQSKEQMLLFFWCLSPSRVECTASVITSCKSPVVKLLSWRGSWEAVLLNSWLNCWPIEGVRWEPPALRPLLTVAEPDGQALGQDSGNDKRADMREKERGDNYSHLGGKGQIRFSHWNHLNRWNCQNRFALMFQRTVYQCYRCHLKEIKNVGRKHEMVF